MCDNSVKAISISACINQFKIYCCSLDINNIIFQSEVYFLYYESDSRFTQAKS